MCREKEYEGARNPRGRRPDAFTMASMPRSRVACSSARPIWFSFSCM